MSPTERYIAEAQSAGMGRDQFKRFLAARVVLQPRQLAASAAARLCDAPGGPTKVGYGGARGGGKSHWGLAQIVCDDLARFAGLKFLYLRKVGKAGKEAVTDLRRAVLHSTDHEWRASDKTILLPNGSKCILGHFKSESDIDAYLGLEYDGALIEEATQLTRRKVTDILTCVRSSKPGWRPRSYFTTNPGNIGHAWFKAMFIAPLRAGNERKTRFVQATVYDNRFVNSEYRDELEGLTGWQRRAWLEGDWDIAAGQYFSTWRRASHVARFEAQPHWEYWIALDYGFTHHTAITLLARDGDGMVYIVDQWCAQRTLPAAHCEATDAMLARLGLDRTNVVAMLAGHDLFSPDQRGGCIADDYAAGGFHFARARIDRVQGAQEFLRRLGEPEPDAGRRPTPPRLLIHERCERLIECLPALMHDPDRPEDVLKVDCDEDGKGGDDPYDSARYGLMHAAAPAAGQAAAGRKVTTERRNPFLSRGR